MSWRMDPDDSDDLDKPQPLPMSAKIFLWAYGVSTLVAAIASIVDAFTRR